MGISDFLKRGMKEMMVARPDEAKDQAIYKHPDQTVPTYAQLTVDSDEVAVFFKDGKVVGKLPPGRHTLRSENIPFIIIEATTTKNEQLEKEGYLYINMDATSEEALVKAGIDSAKGIVTAVGSDANNVFIALTAKGLRPDIFVLSRASDVKNEAKLIKAGASRVVSPYVLGGRRMAEVLKRPTVVDFIDIAIWIG